MSQFFLQANYRVLPNFSEIREWENKLKNHEQIGDNLDFRPEVHHEIFDSAGIILFDGQEWKKTIMGEDGFKDFEDVFDSGEDYPVAYVESTSTLGLGKWQRQNPRQILDWSNWLGEEESYIDWQEIILDASKEFSSDSSKEQYLSSLLELEWHPSVDWETGIDEGNFEIVKEIWEI